ncbi:MAG: tetratricopeptide repeat protein [Acidobacteria bacterium]|nr:tetratricopeptide repeat protein [Acidobacteriota bacterium]
MTRFRFFITVLIIAAVFSGIISADKVNTKKLYQEGMALYKNSKYEEAIVIFDKLITGYPKSDWAALALFQKAIHMKDVAYDTANAQTLFKQFISSYSKHSKVPEAYIKLSEISLESATSMMELNAPLAILENVIRTYPKSQYCAEAAFEAAQIYHRMGDIKKAYTKLQLIDQRFRNTTFYADALLLKGVIHFQQEEYTEAAKQFQAVVNLQSASAAGYKAGQYLQATQRLDIAAGYVYSSDPLFYTRGVMKFENPTSLFMNRYNQLVVFSSKEQQYHIFDMAGNLVNSTPVSDAEIFYMSNTGSTYSADKTGNINFMGQIQQLSITTDTDSITLKTPKGIATDSFNNIYLINNTADKILRFSSAGAFQTAVSKREFDEIIALRIDNFDHLFVIDDDFDGILIFKQTGADFGAIKSKGDSYEMDSPVNIKFDSLNNIYVFDDDRMEIFVFNTNQQFIRSIKIPAPIKKVIDFIVSDSAEIFILDEELEKLLKIS